MYLFVCTCMPTKTYETPEELLNDLTPTNRTIVERVREIFRGFFEVTESVKAHGIVRKFSNRTWRYCNAYNKEFPILGCSHVKYIVKKYPMLAAWFDKEEKYVGKVFLYDVETIERKAIEEVVRLVSEMSDEDAFLS